MENLLVVFLVVADLALAGYVAYLLSKGRQAKKDKK